jgi:uncharacterized RDD family membrane protein YckC
MAGFIDSEKNALDTSLGMQTPEGIEFVLFPAGISIRACAWGIDCIIKGAALLAVLVFVSAVNEILGVWFFFILNFVLNWFYYVIFEMAWNGQTPGKRIMGIRVVGGDGSPVKAGASFIRNLLRFADGFFFLYLIGFISAAASPGFRRFGDWAGDTLVIYTARSKLPGRFIPPAMQKPEAVPWLAGIQAIYSQRQLNYEEKQGILMFARRYPLLGKERADEIAHPWAARLRQNDPPDMAEISDSQYLLGIAHTISGLP